MCYTKSMPRPDSTNHREIKITHRDYPSALRNIPNPPEQIFVRGELDGLDTSPSVAIIGTRKATVAGVKLAERLAEELGQAGLTIISGLAMGIDAAAHRGALKAGARTLTVLAGGINQIYPAQNRNLATEILEKGGAIISEHKTKPSMKYQFLDRNRIVSGLSLGILVIEAPERSGTLSTAGHAAEQGKTVFVVPGPIGHENYVGAHKLIRDGARLVTSSADIIDDLIADFPQLENILRRKTSRSTGVLEELENDTERAIVMLIKLHGEPITIDKIIEDSKLDPQIVIQTLTFLNLRGIVRDVGGKYTL